MCKFLCKFWFLLIHLIDAPWLKCKLTPDMFSVLTLSACHQPALTPSVHVAKRLSMWKLLALNL